MVSSGIVLVILMGMLYSIQLQISKAMERQYIDTYKIISNRIKQKKKLKEEGKQETLEPISKNEKKIFYLYIFALAMNNTVVIYVWIAGIESEVPKTYFTSVIGVGLVALLIYSRYVMKEPLGKNELVGALILIIGTFIIGYDSILRGEINESAVDVNMAMILIGIFYLLGISGMYFAIKKKNAMIIGLIFGLFAGGNGALDPVLKGIGLAQGAAGNNALPMTASGWFAFVMSFITAFLAFGITQWGFAKGARANVLVPAYNSMFVILPQLMYPVLLPGYHWFWSTYVGVILIVLGIVIMQAFGGASIATPEKSGENA